MTIPLVCMRCAGALPPPAGSSPFVCCPYCGTTHAVSAPKIELQPVEKGPSTYELRQIAEQAAWQLARTHSTDPVVAVRAVVAVFGASFHSELEAERAARLAEALLVGFDAKHNTRALYDMKPVLRVADAAVKVIIEFRSASLSETEVNLPYLWDSQGNIIHLSHEVTRATLEGLDQLGIFHVREAAPPSAAPVAAVAVAAGEKPKARKGWWPFGG